MALCHSERIPLPRRELERVREDSRTTLARLVEALEQAQNRAERAEHERDQLQQRLGRALHRERVQQRLIGELRRQRGRTRRRSGEQTSLILEKP